MNTILRFLITMLFMDFKSTKSSVFSDRVATTDEVHDLELQQQNAKY